MGKIAEKFGKYVSDTVPKNPKKIRKLLFPVFTRRDKAFFIFIVFQHKNTKFRVWYNVLILSRQSLIETVSFKTILYVWELRRLCINLQQLWHKSTVYDNQKVNLLGEECCITQNKWVDHWSCAITVHFRFYGVHFKGTRTESF